MLEKHVSSFSKLHICNLTGYIYLLHILLVPSIRKKLISIPKLCRDFNCHIEFDFAGFVVKMTLGMIIFFGSNLGGLYQLGDNNGGSSTAPQNYFQLLLMHLA